MTYRELVTQCSRKQTTVLQTYSHSREERVPAKSRAESVLVVEEERRGTPTLADKKDHLAVTGA